jgi:hypothetical protein
MKRDSCRASAANARAEKWQDRTPWNSSDWRFCRWRWGAGGFLAGVPLEVRMPPRIGTFLAIIIPTSISSYRAHDAPAAAFHFALA